MKAKEKHLSYYMTDTHWNSYGAFIGYTEIMKRIARYYPNIKVKQSSDFIINTTIGNGGDLAGMLALADNIIDTNVILQPKFTVRARIIKVPYEKSAAFVVEDNELPRLVMSRDSFTIALAPYLAEHFSRSVYIWNYKFNNDIIDKEKPGVVIYEIAERYLDELIN